MMMLGKTKLWILIIISGLVLGFALPLEAQDKPLPVTQSGPYQVGLRAITLTDPDRGDRSLLGFIWYPAKVSADSKPPLPPDPSGGPYPLIIYSHGDHSSVLEAQGTIKFLVSRGFVVAGVDHLDTSDRWLSFVNRPLDILKLIDQIANLKADDPLTGVVDTDHVGIYGASFGGYTALATSGAQVDPQNFSNWCPTYADDPNNKTNFDTCTLLPKWDQLTAYHDKYDPPTPDGSDLWAATTDSRIKAIFAVVPCFGQMFGEKGLAPVTLPVFIVGGTEDHTCPYAIDAAYYYQHLGSKDRYLVSLQGRDHSGSFSLPNLIPDYLAAFFGLYLQGQTDYEANLTPDTANAFKNATLDAQVEDAQSS